MLGLLSYHLPLAHLCPAHRPGAGAGGYSRLGPARAQAHLQGGLRLLRAYPGAAAHRRADGAAAGGYVPQAGVPPDGGGGVQ